MAKNKADLDAVIQALPGQIAAAVETALAPIIKAIQDKSAEVDLTDEVAALGNVGQSVADKVTQDLTAPPAPPPTEPPTP